MINKIKSNKVQKAKQNREKTANTPCTNGKRNNTGGIMPAKVPGIQIQPVQLQTNVWQ